MWTILLLLAHAQKYVKLLKNKNLNYKKIDYSYLDLNKIRNCGATNISISCITEITDKATIKSQTYAKKESRNPWITKALIKSCNVKQ